MSADSLEDLLLRWEELCDQGQSAEPEELCRDCPELLDELRRRIRALQALRPALDGTGDASTVHAAPLDDTGPLPYPAIPGYEIVGELGRGGMGVVYKARQQATGRLVALKMIVAGPRAGTDLRRRFRTEAEAVARLHHPNIVRIHEVGEHEHGPYLVLEYVEGRSLYEVLADGASAPAAALVEQAARAVDYAHRRGVVHRDLKPGNILLTADGTPKITDFGLAKRLDELQSHTRSGDVLGTPSYMAPEQAAGQKNIGPAVDVYSLGAILYELLTGTPPFLGASACTTLGMVLSQEPVPPSQRQSQVPPDLEAICLKCLCKAPAQRYASAQGLADDLRRFQQGKPVAARPAGPLERGVRWLRGVFRELRGTAASQ